MAIYYPGDNCQNQVPEHLCDPCRAIELAGVRSIAFIADNFTFTSPTNTSEWTAGIASEDIIIIPETNGTFDGGAPQEGAGFGDNPTSLDGYDFSLNYFDPNFIDNCDFYNTIKNSRNSWKVAFRTGSQVYISDKTVTILPKMPIAADVKGKVLWDVTVKWTSQNLPCSYNTPTNVFRCVQNL